MDDEERRANARSMHAMERYFSLVIAWVVVVIAVVDAAWWLWWR